ncbi:MAG: AAA family ATPase [Chloracidobacterium sp.]
MLVYDCVPPGYQVLSEVYRSDRTLVLRAQRMETGEPVILKTTVEAVPAAALVLRYDHEWSLLSLLAASQPSAQVARAYDLTRVGHRPVLVAEDFGGQALRYAVNAYTDLPLTERLAIAIEVLTAIESVHAAGILHKDVNPANIVINRTTRQVKLIDFGIAVQSRRVTAGRLAAETFEGTLAYIAPEQTGRLSRTVDARADLYAFGVSLYELLTGTLPFHANDALEMLHGHLALTPPPAHQRNRRLPPVLSDIVAKLMAKSPDDRYQTAAGARFDLAEVLHQLTQQGDHTQPALTPFPLGRRDAATFVVPKRLYGRAREIALLQEAFDRVCQSGHEMVLVSGASGIGKTALIGEIQVPVLARRGFFITGKYDQLRGNTPYSAISAACRQLARQLLAQSDAELASWRATLTAALGSGAAILLPLVPELALIVGEAQPVVEISAMEARPRLESAFASLLGAFATRQRPIVLFLDDVQWADAASLDLLAALARSRHTTQALFILAYRDQETPPGHPLLLTLDAIRATGLTMTHIKLSPLTLESVTQLTAAAMDHAPDATAVAEVVHRKTGGNPFFVRELLERLAADGWLTYQPEQGWRADLAGIATARITEHVVAFLIEKLHRCAPDVQRILQAAACLGNHVETAQVALAAETTVADVQAALEAAVEANLVVGEAVAGRRPTHFLFVHDRVQQAAYELVPEAERQARHWRIGRNLLNDLNPSAPSTSTASSAARLFDIATHLNRGHHLATAAEREELAHLNLHAGRAAKRAAAFAPALVYLQTGLGLLPETAWTTHYELALHLHLEAAEAAFFSARPQTAEGLAQAVFDHARSLADALPAHEVAILAYSAQYRFHDAIGHGRSVLRQLGVDLPEQPTRADIGPLWVRLESRLTSLDLEALLSMPDLEDPQAHAAMRLLYRISVPAFLSDSVLFTLVVLWRVELTLRHGINTLTASSFVALGLVVSGGFDDPARGYLFGHFARNLLDRLPSSEARVRTLTSYYFFLHIWREPVRETIEPLRAAYREGVETGELEFASTALLALTWVGIFIGQPLDALERDARAHGDAIRALRQERNYRTNQLCLAYTRNLRVKTDDPMQLTWGEGNQPLDDAAVRATGDYGTLGTLAYLRMKLAYFFGDIQRAYEQSVLCETNMTGLQSSCLQPNVYLFGALTRLARLRAGGVDEPEANAMWDWLGQTRRRLARWAELAPMNYAQKLHLVDAEIHAARGETGAALDAYDRAIAVAREQGFIHEEAMANECAARFFLEQGRTKIARAYAADARRAYARWGATEKVRHLDEQFQVALGEVNFLRSTGTHLALTGTGTADHTTTGSTSFDVASVMKAARVLSGEIVQEQLLDALLRIALENAGATRGVLLLPHDDGQWYVEAERDVHQSVDGQPSRRLTETNTLPASVIHLVTRTGESVLLADATESADFGADPYVQATGVRSVLCLPAQHRGQIRAVLYLEHRAVTNAFTVQRREALTILAAQAAVSLENARLYASLEEKVRRRTEELAEKNRRLEQTTSEILDSLRYAERIQRAILPTPEEFTQCIIEHFVFWRPRDIVSGDFYWLYGGKPPGGQARWLAVVDCTGHGVPGALMAMIGNELLNQIVIERGIESPAAALDTLDASIRAAFRHDARQDGQRDGMDVALCRLDADGSVTFAGAGRPLYIVERGVLREVRGDRGSIGSRIRQRRFTEQRLSLAPGAMLYLGSDGFADQNNPLGQRYGSRALKQLLAMVAPQPLPLQRQQIEQDFDQHRAGEPQRDDVTLVGVRLG